MMQLIPVSATKDSGAANSIRVCTSGICISWRRFDPNTFFLCKRFFEACLVSFSVLVCHAKRIRLQVPQLTFDHTTTSPFSLHGDCVFRLWSYSWHSTLPIPLHHFETKIFDNYHSCYISNAPENWTRSGTWLSICGLVATSCFWD